METNTRPGSFSHHHLTITKEVKKKMARVTKYTVFVGRVGTALKKIEVPEGTTVEEAIEEAGLKIKDTEQVRVNAEIMDLEDEVNNNDNILLVRSVEGGAN